DARCGSGLGAARPRRAHWPSVAGTRGRSGSDPRGPRATARRRRSAAPIRRTPRPSRSRPVGRRSSAGHCAERPGGRRWRPRDHGVRRPGLSAPRVMCGLGYNAAMDSLDLSGRRFTLHRAVAADLPELVALFADDVRGREWESDDLAPYEQALALIDRGPNQLLLA